MFYINHKLNKNNLINSAGVELQLTETNDNALVQRVYIELHKMFVIDNDGYLKLAYRTNNFID